MRPHVSVVMPLYNAAEHLREAIDSILRQTLQGWELVCIDDGSSDETPRILAGYAQKDRRIRVVANGRQGIVATLNRGCAESRGEFIARLDGDDVALPHRLAHQRQYLQADSDLAMVAGGYETIDPAGRPWKSQLSPQSPEDMAAALLRGNCIAHSSVMFRREVIEKFHGPYREHFPLAEDYDLWLRMIGSERIGSVPEVVIQYRRNLATTDPWRVARQTLATLSAKLAHRQRTCGDAESVLAEGPLDRHSLVAHGLGERAIDAAVRRALLSEARLSARHGHRETSRRLLHSAAEYGPRGEGFKVWLDYSMRRLQVRLAKRRPALRPKAGARTRWDA